MDLQSSNSSRGTRGRHTEKNKNRQKKRQRSNQSGREDE